MMAKSAADRFASTKATAEALAAIVKGDAPQPPADSTTSQAGTRQSRRSKAGPIKSSASKAAAPLAETDVETLVELARECMAKHDYEQVILMLQQVPEDSRIDAVYILLERAREMAEEITYLLAEIDEALRMRDNDLALKKVDELLKIKPGHHRANEVKQQLTATGLFGWLPFGGGRRSKRGRNEKPWGLFSGKKLLVVALVALAAFGLTWGIVAMLPDGESSNEKNAANGSQTPTSRTIKTPETAKSQWVDLFNGSDLTGWTTIGDLDGWSVVDPNTENARIAYDGNEKLGWLVTDKEYSDFVLEFEYKLEAGGNSGVFIRAVKEGNKSGVGKLEVQLLDDAVIQNPERKLDQLNGSLWSVVPVNAQIKTKDQT